MRASGVERWCYGRDREGGGEALAVVEATPTEHR